MTIKLTIQVLIIKKKKIDAKKNSIWYEVTHSILNSFYIYYLFYIFKKLFF